MWTSLFFACVSPKVDSDPKGFDTASDSTPVDSAPESASDSDVDPDADGDGFAASVDCDDADASVNPGAVEGCDGHDDDCDGETDEDAPTWYADTDGDGRGDPSASKTACEASEGWVRAADDCDDAEPLAWTDAPERCDGVDNDCDGGTDDDAVDAVSGPVDLDGDGFGDPDHEVSSCDPLVNALDCDDADPFEPQVVDASFSGTSDGSAAAPWTSVQDGIDAAVGCVVVEPGDYFENISLDREGLSVVSTGGSALTTLEGDGTNSVVFIDAGGGRPVRVEGFTVTGGGGVLDYIVEISCCTEDDRLMTTTWYRYYGGGLCAVDTTVGLSDMRVLGHTLAAYSYTSTSPYEQTYVESYGGGIAVVGGTLEATDLEIVENQAVAGGGLYIDGEAVVAVTRSELSGNLAGSGGAIQLTDSELSLTNALLIDDEASELGGAVEIDEGVATVRNVTVAGAQGGAFFLEAGARLSLTGAAVIDTHGVGIEVVDGSTVNPAYSDVYGSTEGDWSGMDDPTGTDGMLSVSPVFVDWTDDGVDNDDLHLATKSPLVDAGDPSSTYDDADGTRNDVGGYGGPAGSW